MDAKEIETGNDIIHAFVGGTWKPVMAGWNAHTSHYIDDPYTIKTLCEAECDRINKQFKHPDEFYFPLPNVKGYELKYHSSWDLLMPVWKKIIEVIGLHMSTNNHEQLWLSFSDDVRFRMYCEVDVEKTFSTIGVIIKYYNSLSTPSPSKADKQ